MGQAVSKMYSNANSLNGKTALITGSAKRIGACTARVLHQAGMNIIIHCHRSTRAAGLLAADLNAERENSARVMQADLNDETIYTEFIQQAINGWGQLDALINNASTFFPTPVGSITLDDWNKLINSNMKAPLFLSQAAAPALKKQQGCIINMADIHALQPMREHPVYCAAKAGLVMITRSLAKELGPEIRVNAVAPGAILWPEDNSTENNLPDKIRQSIIERTALKRTGMPEDIARAILFLVRDADYITGQILPVDGGRLLNI